MRGQFAGYFSPTDQEIDALFSDALVVLDTNALLNLYRYKRDARESFINMLTVLQNRLWLPHQVGAEFHRRRVSIIREQYRVVEKVAKILDSTKSSLAGELSQLRRNAVVDIDPILSAVTLALQTQKTKMDTAGNGTAQIYGIAPQDDPVLRRIAGVYQDRIGLPLTEEQFDQIRKEGEERYVLKCPPGYRDAEKDGDAKYGDFIIWKQILSHAAEKQKHVLFLTDDNKEDWWWISEGETLGPRPELRDEFFREVGQMFYIYRPSYFLEKLTKRGQIDASNAVVREVEETSQLSNAQAERKAHARRQERISTSLGMSRSRAELERLLGFVDAKIAHADARLEEGAGRQRQSRSVAREVALLKRRANDLLRQENDLFAEAADAVDSAERERLTVEAKEVRSHRKSIELSVAGADNFVSADDISNEHLIRRTRERDALVRDRHQILRQLENIRAEGFLDDGDAS